MLLLPKSVFYARQRLWLDLKAGKLTDEAFYQKLLDLDADDYIGLSGSGGRRWEAGDDAGAEESYWHAIEANPCVWEPYLDLARVLYRGGSPDLANGLGELGLLKRMRAEPEEVFQEADYEKAGIEGEVLEKLKQLPASAKVELLTLSMRENRADEPESVTERLRPLRLIERMLEEGAPSEETVDAFIAAGSSVVPLLVGVLRAWAQDFLDEDGDTDLENALALLGETGSPAEIPHVLEFVDLTNQIASGASEWALGRIIERYPEESAKLIESIVPALGMAARIKVAEQMLRYPDFDPAAKLLKRLSENMESITQDDRDSFFPALVGVMAGARGRQGVDLGRAAFRSQASLLSRTARRECEDLLTALTEEGMARISLPPSPFTVYDICAGDADWGVEKDEETEDELLPAPEPIRRQATPGRNDPCWCNSGKKYKKCHLDSDEFKRREMTGVEKTEKTTIGMPGEFNHLRRGLGEFVGQVLPKREMKQALLEFYGEEPRDEKDELPLIDWMIHDRFSPTLGQTVLEEFLKRRPRLTTRERDLLEAWSRSYVGLYEVRQLKVGTGAELNDLITGETFFVHDISISRKLAKWDGLFARVAPGERGTELGGAALTVPRMQLEKVREWMDNDREESRLSWPEYLKNNWPRIRRQSLEIAANWMESLQLSNTDGEELLLSKAVYTILDEDTVIRALESGGEFTEDSGEGGHRSFVWLNQKKTLLGNIRIGSEELTLECNSRERLERGKLLIPAAAGASLRHLRDEFTTQKDLKRRMKEEPREASSGKSEVPKEVRDEILTRVMEDHYSGWPDTALPALDGKTPRQAVKTAKGRRIVREVLKLIENGEEWKRQRGEPFFDVGKIRADLGLDE
jgi:hypothetical protein